MPENVDDLLEEIEKNRVAEMANLTEEKAEVRRERREGIEGRNYRLN